jgi:MarR family transcriptional regulator, organic hydroperoxide resistance regulator
VQKKRMADHDAISSSGAAGRPTASLDVGTRYDGPGASPGFALWRVAAIWQREVRAALAEVELTHAQFVLLVSSAWLEAADDVPVTQALVSAHANTDAVMTSEVLRTLERRKLVRRLPHPTDARARQIVLTPAGKKLSRRAVALVEAVDEAFFAAPRAELQALARFICPRASD